MLGIAKAVCICKLHTYRILISVNKSSFALESACHPKRNEDLSGTCFKPPLLTFYDRRLIIRKVLTEIQREAGLCRTHALIEASPSNLQRPELLSLQTCIRA